MSSFSIEITLAIIGVLLIGLDAFMTSASRYIVPWLAIFSTGAALVALAVCGHSAAPAFAENFYATDSLSFFYKCLALVTTFVVLVLALELDAVTSHFTSAESVRTRIGEFYALPLIICAGMMWMASAKDLISVFVPLELVTVAFYVLVAFTRRNAGALEAGVKYLILGALSTGILVYGIAWLYGAAGSMSFSGIAAATTNAGTSQSMLLFGAALVLAGLGFKVAAAPFHVWVPDVYQGASHPVTAFLSVGSKAAGFVVLTRTVEAFTVQGSMISTQVKTALLVSAALTILFGSLPALFQTSIKRLFAYSSISHAGFLLLALACSGSVHFGLSSSGVVAFYLATYLPMTLLGFLVLTVLRARGVSDDLKDLAGLSKRSPQLAFLLTLACASMAGLPLTAGFLGKMLVFLAAVEQCHYGVVGIAVIGAAAGFYYYFRPILAAYSGESAVSSEIKLAPSGLARATGMVLALAVVVLGVYPKLISSAAFQVSPEGAKVAVQPKVQPVIQQQ
jgi:NADH-quinone oxidoreductase subunit N